MLNAKFCTRNMDQGNELIDVRENLAKLGNSLPLPLYIRLQAFLTWLTGKPHKGQKPLYCSSRKYELIKALASLFSSAMLSSLILQSSPLFFVLLPIPWLVTVGSARKILACLIHRCVHGQFFGDKRDRILGEILSTLIMVQGFDGYRHAHVHLHHHRDYFATFENDPDAQFVLSLGFRPGLKDDDKDN
jgi:Fatty acid desaturase